MLPRIILMVVYNTLVVAAITLKTADLDLYYYMSIVFASGVCFSVTYFQDYHKVVRPAFLYRLSCSIAASYMAYFLYPSVSGFEIDILFIKFKPFETIQIFVGLCSYFGITIFKELSRLKSLKYNLGEYFSKIGDKLKGKK